jgi:alkanesulfonate monooxygenase SsuD/methylene tetrahydromethanopterin reductase-like flavin-dependent oxidoreductase (luciferase family)
MRINLMIEPQEGMTYTELLALARRAEALGFEALYRSDHYASVFDREEVGSTDAWATLAGLARDTHRIMLGTLVSPATFRPPAQLAKVVVTVAEMAGTASRAPDELLGSAPGWSAAAAGASRVHLGLGTGWLASEHLQYGFPVDDVATRFRRLEELLQVVRGLWDPSQDPFSFEGEFERLVEARFVPKPNPRPRIIVGGRGRTKTMRLAVTYADELNIPSATPAECRELRDALYAACERYRRSPSTITFSLMTGCLVGATERELRARAARLEKLASGYPRLADYRRRVAVRGIVGTPEEAAERLGQLAQVGVERIMLQHLLHDDLELLDLVAEEIVPRLGRQDVLPDAGAGD